MRYLRILIAALLLVPALELFAEDSYTLLDGRIVTGEAISYTAAGVVLRSGATILPRTPWTEFTQESLKRLAARATNPRDAAFVEPHIEELVEARARRAEIEIRAVPRPEPPERTGVFQMFTSPLGLVLLLLLYSANIYAGYEVATYRNQPYGLVCGVAAVAPVIGPAVFLAMPTRRYELVPDQGPAHQAPPPAEEVLVAHDEPLEAEAAAAAGAAARTDSKPKLPPSVKFARGEFTFNRRFFETKLPGFLRVVPGDAEKDMVVAIKSARGDFTGKRITQLTQTSVTLQIFKGDATADEEIPFVEVREVEVKHKDAS